MNSNLLAYIAVIFIFIVKCKATDNNQAIFKVCDLNDIKYQGHCMNHGVCYNLIEHEKIYCSCPAEFTGKRCEERLLKPTGRMIASAQRSIITDNLCSNMNCKNGQICKYFDSKMYRCPSDIMNCEPYKKLHKIPICVSANFNEVCMETLKMGNCSTYKERYYFDVIDQTCKKFYFTGCNGNRNNFQTKQECSTTCSPLKKSLISAKRIKKIETVARKTINKLEKTSKLQKKVQKEILRPTGGPSKIEIPSPVNKCEFVCTLNCPFGYRLNYFTNCPVCECSQLEVSECGVPCFKDGAVGCEFAMRANSRPECKCRESYSGVYCHIYNRTVDFIIEFNENSLKLSKSIELEISNNLQKELAELLQTGQERVNVNEVIINDQNNKINVKFNVHAADFVAPKEFDEMIEYLKYSLNQKIHLVVHKNVYTISQSKLRNNENEVSPKF